MPHYAIFFIFLNFLIFALCKVNKNSKKPHLSKFALFKSALMLICTLCLKKEFLHTQISQHYQKLLTWIGTLPAFGAMLDNDKIGQLYYVIHHYFRYQSYGLTVIFCPPPFPSPNYEFLYR